MQDVSLFNSLDTPTKFKLTLVGQINQGVAKEAYISCDDGTQLRVIPAIKDYPDRRRLWHLVPTIDSTAVITNVRVLNSSPLELEQDNNTECVLEGKVLQVSKRQQVVLFSVEQPSGKELKITLTNPDGRMKAEQIWSVKAFLVGNKLQIVQARPLSGVEESEKTAGSKLIIAAPSPPTHKAIAALALETGVDGWEVITAKRRSYGWEWEAIATHEGRRARVVINNAQCQVHQYNSNIALAVTENDTKERLVVTPLGAARGIGASCFQVEIGPYEVVLDCGTRPKGYDPLPALEYLNNPNLLLLTHGHNDHIGAVPIFHTQFPAARMVCTPGTREIAHIMLTDCLKVQQRNEDSEALFDELELERTLFHLETEPIGQDFEPLPGLKVRFINAGHIVGAACIYLRYGERSLLYTGDYNTASSRTTEGLKLADLPAADVLITESTYGGDTHPARKTQETALMQAIAAVAQAGGNVLIPAFALGRAQEILLAIRTSAIFQKLDIPIYVDGLVRSVTDTFRENLELLPLSVQNMVNSSGTEPFMDEKSKPIVIPIAHTQERALAMVRPSVIIASSGMLNGGASVYYAKTLLERDNAAIFISGYTDEESPGRLLQSLKTGDVIELDGEDVSVRAQIKRFNLSAHADKVGLTQVISKVNPKHLILVHGSPDALHELARTGGLKDKHYVHIPRVGDKIEYSVVPENLRGRQQARIEAPQEFEVEVVDEKEGAWIRIPKSVVESDPRWQILASNGVLKAKWDGIALKLLAATQLPLMMNEAKMSALASSKGCCVVCQYYEQNTSCCRCIDSPLEGRVVDPSGYCLEYVTLIT